MNDLVWIIAAEKQSFLGNNGISPVYIVPWGQMNGYESELDNKIMWILLRGRDDRLLGAITIKKVERFIEGLNQGDYLIYSDSTLSIRLCSNYETAKKYSLANTLDFAFGINFLERENSNLIRAIVAKSIEIRLNPPQSQKLKTILFDPVYKNGRRKIIDSISKIIENFNLDEIWGSGIGPKLNPVANFALTLLNANENHPLDQQYLLFLKALDPIIYLSKPSVEYDGRDNESIKKKRRIDLYFTQIMPETVYAREFIASRTTGHNLELALLKTDAAEKAHQAMLRDISQYLRSNNIPSYETTSIDLMINRGSRTKIFELKSADNNNILSQAAKGAFQIASYANAMKTEFEELEPVIIISKITDENLEIFVADALNFLNIKYLVYDMGKAWPARLIGLLD